MIVGFFRTSRWSADIPVREFVFILALALPAFSTGCRKKPEVQATRISSQPNPTNTPAPPVIAQVLSNSVATNPLAGASASIGEAGPPIVRTNVVASAAPKPPAPGQDIYDQALAVMRTNLTAAAAQEAVILFRAAAEKGNPAAQHALGVASLSGLGIKKDVEEGIKWLEKSAEQKNPDALFKLASLYARGVDLPRNEAKAAELARAAAELGHAEAQYNLASLYAAGRGVPKDLKEAANWYLKAAEGGHPTAASNLGVLYATGEGVEKNPAEAVKWWQKAAEKRQASAQFNLAHALQEGKIVPRDPVEAYKWYHLAAEDGDNDAAVARDALGVEMAPSDIATALKRAREFNASAFAKWQEHRPSFE